MTGRKLPPLNALRAFEAAARHGSFSLAAAELNVTHAAVSRHIRGLEDRLGVRLFHRLHKAVALTEAGHGYLPRLTEAFDRIADATERLIATAATTQALSLSVEPGFAARWLVPRLGRFLSRHPAVELNIDPTARLVDVRREAVDLMIRYGSGGWPGLATRRIGEVAIYPVCSPALVDGPAPLRTPADLARHTLIHDETRQLWAAWLAAAGAAGVDAAHGPVFRDAGLVLSAAANGQGVALGDDLLAMDDLAAGRLVRPFELRLPVGFYWLAWPADRPPQAAATQFRDWLLAEAGAVEPAPHAALDGARAGAP